MEDLGDYIYLIFIAIAVVSSFFGKKKKKGTEPNEHPAPATNWQEIIKQMAEGKELVDTPEPAPVKVAPVVAKAATVLPTQEPMVSVKSAAEGTRSVVNRTAVVDDEEASQSSLLVELDDQEDAAKAIIYSEILTRKY
jgi:hypothetical protein